MSSESSAAAAPRPRHDVGIYREIQAAKERIKKQKNSIFNHNHKLHLARQEAKSRGLELDPDYVAEARQAIASMKNHLSRMESELREVTRESAALPRSERSYNTEDEPIRQRINEFGQLLQEAAAIERASPGRPTPISIFARARSIMNGIARYATSSRTKAFIKDQIAKQIANIPSMAANEISKTYFGVPLYNTAKATDYALGRGARSTRRHGLRRPQKRNARGQFVRL